MLPRIGWPRLVWPRMEIGMDEMRTKLFDVDAIRADFPILSREVHGRPLVYLDNAASAQKPVQVTGRMQRVFDSEYSNVHRGLHYLSNTSTEAFEGARRTVRNFLNAASDTQIIFTGGATDAINLVAHSYLEPRLKPGDEIILSEMEHHSNIVPWQLVCEAGGAKVVVVDVDAAVVAVDTADAVVDAGVAAALSDTCSQHNSNTTFPYQQAASPPPPC